MKRREPALCPCTHALLVVVIQHLDCAVCVNMSCVSCSITSLTLVCLFENKNKTGERGGSSVHCWRYGSRGQAHAAQPKVRGQFGVEASVNMCIERSKR